MNGIGIVYDGDIRKDLSLLIHDADCGLGWISGGSQDRQKLVN